MELGPERVGFVLADVSGKGMSAALLMANLQASIRSQYSVASENLPQILQSVNRLFYENTEPNRYTTLFAGSYDGRRPQAALCELRSQSPSSPSLRWKG